jgi:hypothetical protein
MSVLRRGIVALPLQTLVADGLARAGQKRSPEAAAPGRDGLGFKVRGPGA